MAGVPTHVQLQDLIRPTSPPLATVARNSLLRGRSDITRTPSSVRKVLLFAPSRTITSNRRGNFSEKRFSVHVAADAKAARHRVPA
ncbi:MAG: hypothetical protein D6741_09460 [Planctomycetota bacterium]|nr:MAG: hypothetical protein D6741_09460 [Planctomycetota bacterium]